MNFLNALIFRRTNSIPLAISKKELQRRISEFPTVKTGGLIVSWKNSGYTVTVKQEAFSFAKTNASDAAIIIAKGEISNENELRLNFYQPKTSNYFFIGFISFISLGTIIVSFTGRASSSYPPFILIGIVYVINIFSFFFASQKLLGWIRNFVSEQPVA